jgi:hypothetical protein
MSQVTEQDVEAAEAALVSAKKAVGTAKSGAKVEAYRAAADELTRVRVAFREQGEQAGTRSGFVSGDAAN